MKLEKQVVDFFLNMIGSCGLCVLQECIAKVQRIFVKM